MSLAEGLTLELEVLLVEAGAAGGALEASLVELLAAVGLEVQALDAGVAAAAQRPVGLVPVARAQRRGGVHVELARRERAPARPAREARLVVPPRQTARRVLHRLLAHQDRLVAGRARSARRQAALRRRVVAPA